MYRCQDCEFEFLYAKQHEEHHQQTEPPFEKLCVCPNCKSTNFSKIKIRYCRFCGRKLKANMSEYCTKECKMRGDIMWREQARRKNLYESNSLVAVTRELESYNRKNHTNYTYGIYVGKILKSN